MDYSMIFERYKRDDELKSPSFLFSKVYPTPFNNNSLDFLLSVFNNRDVDALFVANDFVKNPGFFERLIFLLRDVSNLRPVSRVVGFDILDHYSKSNYSFPLNYIPLNEILIVDKFEKSLNSYDKPLYYLPVDLKKNVEYFLENLNFELDSTRVLL